MRFKQETPSFGVLKGVRRIISSIRVGSLSKVIAKIFGVEGETPAPWELVVYPPAKRILSSKLVSNLKAALP